MIEQEALSVMVPPSRRRPGIWSGGIMQIHITRACDQSCFGCTQGSNLGGKPVLMTPDQFEEAVASMQGYFGVIGVFGGNPCVSPYFEEICEILRKLVPQERRGLWSNHPRGKGAICRKTFNPAFSNLNVHLNRDAFEEFARDWPECRSVIKGRDQDSRHSPPFVAIQDIVPDEGVRWQAISECDINRNWSAIICVFRGELRGFFCELAGAQAMLHQEDPNYPDLGVPVVPGWWNQSMEAFAAQVRFHCHACGIPAKGFGSLAVGGEKEQVSKTHQAIYQPKETGRLVELVTDISQLNGKLERVTDYVENGSIAKGSANRAACGCTHRTESGTGIVYSVTKCPFHSSRKIDPEKCDRRYFERLGVMVIERGGIVAHVDEMVRALGAFPLASAGDRCLEVGCGISHYAQHLMSIGYKYSAIEASPFAASWMSERLDVVVQNEKIEDAVIDGKFALILAAHIIEHVADPISVLNKLSQHLSPSGQLRILVPEGTDRANPDHLSFFDERSLCRAIRAAGMQVQQVRTLSIVSHERFIYAVASIAAFPRVVEGAFGQSWVSEEELSEIIRCLPENGQMIEIGTASGVTAAMVAAVRPAAKILSVDPFLEKSERLSDWMANRGEGMRLLIGVAEDLGESVYSASDLVFIDGDHSFAGCLSDLLTASECSLLLCHDYGDPNHVGVKAAVDRFLSELPQFAMNRIVGSIAVLYRSM